MKHKLLKIHQCVNIILNEMLCAMKQNNRFLLRFNNEWLSNFKYEIIET